MACSLPFLLPLCYSLSFWGCPESSLIIRVQPAMCQMRSAVLCTISSQESVHSSGCVAHMRKRSKCDAENSQSNSGAGFLHRFWRPPICPRHSPAQICATHMQQDNCPMSTVSIRAEKISLGFSANDFVSTWILAYWGPHDHRATCQLLDGFPSLKENILNWIYRHEHFLLITTLSLIQTRNVWEWLLLWVQ